MLFLVSTPIYSCTDDETEFHSKKDKSITQLNLDPVTGNIVNNAQLYYMYVALSSIIVKILYNVYLMS